MSSTHAQTEEEEEDNLYGLFVSEEYVPRSFCFGELSQALLCSPMSSTDHDLTGQIVWPASLILTWFLRHRVLSDDAFAGRSVLELGAGCGLAGFFLATHGHTRHVEITDGNEIVCRLLEKNRVFLGFDSQENTQTHTHDDALTQSHTPTDSHTDTQRCTVGVRKLLWGLKDEMRALWGSPEARFPDYLVGADIILWPNQVRALLCTIRWSLFARLAQSQRPGETPFVPRAFVSYVVRAHSTTELLLRTAAELGLAIEVVPRESFVPADCLDFARLETRLFEISLSAEEVARGCDFWNEQAPEVEEQNRFLAMPC